MDQKAYFLTQKDRDDVSRLLAEYRARYANTSQRPRDTDPSDDNVNPEVYIAKVPLTGIPGLTIGTGTGSEQGHPGFADCPVYRVLELTLDSPKLSPVTGLFRRVYNISKGVIGDGTDQWIGIKRDKFGTWIPDMGAGAAENGQWMRLVGKRPGLDGNLTIYDAWPVIPVVVEVHTVIGGTGTGTGSQCDQVVTANMAFRYTQKRPDCKFHDVVYHVTNCDLPHDPDDIVGTGSPFPSQTVVWARREPTTNRLFIDTPPRWDDVVKIGPAFYVNGVQYYPAARTYYNQDSPDKHLCMQDVVLLRVNKCSKIGLTSIPQPGDCCQD